MMGSAAACPACSSTRRRSKTSSVVPERFLGATSESGRRAEHVAVVRVTTYKTSAGLDQLRATLRWRRPSGARRTAAAGRRPSNAPARVETCEFRNQSTSEVAQGYEAFVATAQARRDAHRAPTDAPTASQGGPSSRHRPRSFCPRISTNENPAFARFDASQARPNAVPAPDFRTGSPSVTTSE